MTSDPSKKEIMSAVVLPPLFAPLPYAIHPASDAVDARSTEFLDRFELFWDGTQRHRMVEIQCGRLAGMEAPEGDTDRLQCLSDFLVWAFAWDDEYCDDQAIGAQPGQFAHANSRLERAVEITEYPLDPSDRYGAALHDIRVRLEQSAGSETGEDFTEWVLGYVRTEMRRVALASAGITEDPDRYVFTRILSGGGMVFPRLAAVVSCRRVPAAYRQDRRLRALTEMVALLVDTENDIFSLPKERERCAEGKVENLVHVLAQHERMDEERALRHVTRLLHSTAALYLRLKDQVVAGHGPDVDAYVQGLTHYWNGSVRWQRDCPRYLNLQGAAGAVTPRELTDQLEPGQSPAGLPVIDWWWQYDPAGRRQ